ncbi:response regulator [Sporichthya sp.]|uniref:response regulator transcription factor n=1 Tax=Sporichthya sp. TaxID=65475 RepID=UPI0017B52B30|nr:response regulator [Sporichthya sp.]MBA3741721.1 response regulator [Sporichthya sp.]
MDDSSDVRTLLCAQLRSMGKYEIVGQAADGKEAVRLAASLQPQVVLLDLSMPEMDGLQALPLILEVAAGVRVIVMSGFDQRRVGAQALAAGAVRYIEKGLRMDLATVIDEVLAVAEAPSVRVSGAPAQLRWST